MDEIDNIIDLVETESREQFSKFYAIEQVIAENDGEWNSDIQHQILTNMNDVAKSLNLLAFAFKALKLKIEVTTPKK